MTDTPPVKAADIKTAHNDVIVQLGTDDIPPSAQGAARAAHAALENLACAVERSRIKTRLSAIERQAQVDRARLQELDGEA